MPTAQGSIVRNSANRITAVFVIDDIQNTFSGTISPAIQPFTANGITLTYNSQDDLTTARSFQGRVGPNTIKSTFDNGPVIEGELNQPGISPASTVDGNGSWEQN